MTEKKPGEPDERIVAAAILREGVVFTGAHHHQIIRYIARTLDLKVVKGEQGFITSSNRFVDRVEAAHIAFAARQIPLEYDGLFSEQLWNLSDYPPSEAIGEIESRARREGAREALERAAKLVAGHLGMREVANAIRALADQPEADGKQASGVADLALMRGEAPTKAKMVGCETADGLLITHPENQTCEVCAPAPAKADTPGTCALCGKPMPRGEEMFKYHGYSGPCPAPEAAHGRKRA